MSDPDWGNLAKGYFDEQVHPRGHGLKIKEVATAVKLASMMKFGGHATLHEASLFWQEFAPGGAPIMPPQDFEHALDHLAPVSYAFHGRPPTLRELTLLRDKSSAEVNRHYGDLPSRSHPEISAAHYIKAFQSARPWARQHLEREPVSSEVGYLHHSGEPANVYYARLAAQNTPQQDGAPTQVRPDSGGRGVPPPR